MKVSNKNPKLSVLVVGAGMYVCGRGTTGFGTVLPTLVQAKKEGTLGEVFVTATSLDSIGIVQQKLKGLNQLFDTDISIHGSDNLVDVLEKIPRPASAIVVVPDPLHTPIAKEVLKAGLPLLLVKPFTPTVTEAIELIELAQKQNLYGAVEFHKRFDEANLLLKQKIKEGVLGSIRYATVEFSQRRLVRELFQKWIQKTNVFQYLGVHYVDLLYFVTGALPLKIAAVGGHDSIQTVITWQHPKTKGTFTSTITTNWIDPNSSSAMSDQKITVVGTLGRYQSDQKNRGVQMVTEKNGVEDINPYFSQIYEGATGKMHAEGYGPRSIQQFLTDVQQLNEGESQLTDLIATRPSFHQALVSTAVVEACRQSLTKEGEWISLEWTQLSKYLPKN